MQKRDSEMGNWHVLLLSGLTVIRQAFPLWYIQTRFRPVLESKLTRDHIQETSQTLPAYLIQIYLQGVQF